MEQKRNRLLHLHYLYADQHKLLQHIISFDEQLTNIYQMLPSELECYLSITPAKAIELYKHLHIVPLPVIPRMLHQQQIQYITIFDEDYPTLLKQIPDPPHVLYLKGKKELLDSVCSLSIVGTRQPTPYAYNSMDYLISTLGEQRWTIVSGLAVGVDTFAHRLAMKYKHDTIAVLGSGFHHLYPAKNRQLAHEISEKHLLLTEYPPHYSPKKWYFPKRNRIISGLSLGTLVVEAKERSGSLITVDCALEQGREVFAIPGPIMSEFSGGTNRLIQQGAKLVYSSKDVMEELLIK